MPKGTSGRESITSVRGMSDMSGLPQSLQQLTRLVIPYLRQQYSDWTSLESALESIEHSPTAEEGNRYQDFERHVLQIIKQNRALASQLDEYFDSDYGLARTILDILRGRY